MKRLLIASLGVAVVAFALPPALFYFGTVGSLTLFYPQSVFMSADVLLAAWLAILVLALRRYRWRSLWLMLGAPLALVWPIWLSLVLWSCTTGSSCP